MRMVERHDSSIEVSLVLVDDPTKKWSKRTEVTRTLPPIRMLAISCGNFAGFTVKIADVSIEPLR